MNIINDDSEKGEMMVDNNDSGKQIMVSVICMAYNHENHIRSALEGFVSQKTDFQFEVFVHDDASTDHTAQIIQEYVDKYPHIIKPIFQKENQHSKNGGIIRNFILPLVKGKYIAWCEGDDCWLSSEKLQKQVSFMESNPGYSCCMHHVLFHNCFRNTDSIIPHDPVERDYGADEIIRGGAIFQLSSVLFRTDIYLQKPSCFNAKGFGDVQIYIYGAMSGKCHVLKEVMSQYNYGVDGSYTIRNAHASKNNRIQHEQEYIRMLNSVNDYYNRVYDDSFQYAIRRLKFRICILEGNYRKARMYTEFWHPFLKDVIRKSLYKVFPFLLRIRRRIKK